MSSAALAWKEDSSADQVLEKQLERLFSDVAVWDLEGQSAAGISGRVARTLRLWGAIAAVGAAMGAALLIIPQVAAWEEATGRAWSPPKSTAPLDPPAASHLSLPTATATAPATLRAHLPWRAVPGEPQDEAATLTPSPSLAPDTPTPLPTGSPTSLPATLTPPPTVSLAPTVLPTSTPLPTASPSPQPTQTAQDRGVPMAAATTQLSRLVIPAIGLDVPIVSVGMVTFEIEGQPVQTWNVPRWRAVGWHQSSALPGQVGNTVLNGHQSSYGGVFQSLEQLQPGDEITLYADDAEYRYRIVERHLLEEAGQSLAVRADNARWILPTADERLTLVTCAPDARTTHRLIIVALPLTADR